MNTKIQKIETLVKSNKLATKDYWINVLSTIPPHQVGVVKSSGKLLSQPELDVLAQEIAYIANEAGFYLPLVIGGGDQYDNAVGKSKKINDIRITDTSIIKLVVDIASENQEKVIDALNKYGVEAKAIPFNSIIVDPHGYEIQDGIKVDMGLVGDIVSIDTKKIISAVHEKTIPIISHIGMHKGVEYNINATTVGAFVAKTLQSKKLILVGDMPVQNENGELIKIIGSELEFNRFVHDGTIQKGMKKNLEEAFEFLHLGPGHSVQITKLGKTMDGHIKSTGLLEELLGDGSGTMISVPYLITQYPIKAVNKQHLTNMINGIFKEQKKKLVPGYFDSLLEKDATIYLDSGNKGGAISYQFDGFEYICKLFTLKDYEGQGISKSIISMIAMHKNSFAWRTSTTNSDACICNYKKRVKEYGGWIERSGEYYIFGVGIEGYAKKQAVDALLKIPASFEPIK
jgi:acetylglutamate kinase